MVELAEAMAVDTEQLEFNPEKRLFDAEELFDMCGGLVRLSSDGTTIGLAHYSVKEYLLSPQLADKEPSLSYFAIDQAQCLDKTAVGLLVYVFYLGLKLHSAEGLTLSDDHYPLVTHARHLWQRKLYHHKQGPDQKWLDSLLSVSCDRFAPMWAQMINTKDVVYNLNNNFSLTNFVHDVVDVTVLAFLEKGLNSSTDVETDIFANLNDYLKMIVDLQMEWEARTSGNLQQELDDDPRQAMSSSLRSWHHGSPLHSASRNGFGNVVRFLLEKGARPDAMSRSCKDANSLCFAAFERYAPFVRAQIEHGADLSTAICQGYESVVRTLRNA